MQHQKIRPAETVALDIAELRRTFGSFATGVAVATTLDSEGVPKGFTANSFTSVSLEPPLVLVCVDNAASCHGAFAAATHFAINILCEAQQHVSRAFASKSADKFAGMLWVSGQVPIGPNGVEFVGKLGATMDVETGRKAARLCAINVLAQAKAALGDLDRITRLVKVSGFVNSAPDFIEQPKFQRQDG